MTMTAPPNYGPQPPGQLPYPTPATPRRRPFNAAAALLAATIAITAMAALTTSILAVNKASHAQSAPAVTTTITAPPPTPQRFDDNADKALCQVLPDLMHESTSRRNTFIDTPVNSPERKAAIPAFKNETQDWATRMEAVLASHAQPDRYLTRTLQRYIDDMLLYSQNIYPDHPFDKFDDDTWNLGIVDYGGALGRCQQLGIRW